MGGKLTAESQAGIGSVFHFTAHFGLSKHEESLELPSNLLC
jgi:hypothetical protein